jgi:hypothetical protein
MSDEKNKSTSIWQKINEAGHAYLDQQIMKAKGQQNAKQIEDEDYLYSKAITDEPSYQINSMGYKEKPHRIINTHLKQMSQKDSIIASIIQTRQNQASNHSRLVKSEQDRGFMIILKDEESFIRKIKEELEAEVRANADLDGDGDIADGIVPSEKTEDIENQDIQKSDEIYSDKESETNTPDLDDSKDDDDVEEINWELERKAKEKLEEEIRNRRKEVEDFIINCGSLEQRPFSTKKWNFDSFLRALVRDSLTYDLMATEIVPNEMGEPHHFFPVDASTIKFAAPSLKKYKTFPGAQANIDLLYPEDQQEALKERDVLELDDDLLEKEKYKYVQVVKGRIERAFTEDEMKVGMRNLTTDIYNNGYGISELELLVSLVSSHLNTEYYNKAYFTQGFSAKGILHLKAPIPRRKLETIRQKWHHMIRGSRNSFQTPIFAGMDEVNWIPLTQNHSDIEFSGWMQYLIKMICSIYQIDPYEVGIGMKDDGGSGLAGDNTSEKIDLSKDKGLYPLLRFLENYINQNIIDMIDSDFCIKFTGIKEESAKEALARQKEEVKFKKTVNEIRSEDNLPPIPGMDDIILDPVFFQWYSQFSKKGRELTQQNQMQGGFGAPMDGSNSDMPSDEDIDSMFNDASSGEEEGIEKSLKIEYYKIGE